MSFWRSDKFKRLYKLVQAFEFIRSEKGHKLNILKLFVRIKINMKIMKKESIGHSIRLRSAADKGTLGSYVFSSMEGSRSYLRDLVSILLRYVA